ncbi:MAG: S-layer homology domain-containing protein [Clostridiales bacterium]|nr:S-layer homology domain-containing protein [Clostridiales bacterium]
MLKKLVSMVLITGIFLSPIIASANTPFQDYCDANYNYMRDEVIEKTELKVVYETSADNGEMFGGARFEPNSGIMLGTPIYNYLPKLPQTLTAFYEEFDMSQTNAVCSRDPQAYNQSVMDCPAESKYVLVNFNMPAGKLIRYDDYSNYIQNTIDGFTSPGRNVIIVIGKEMNLSPNYAHPDDPNPDYASTPKPADFVDLFRKMASYIHTKSNAAVCWSPNDLSSLDLDYGMFYPGDEYVDWVGVSSYSCAYFPGQQDVEGMNVAFVSGRYANPVARLKPIVQFMRNCGMNKPLILTESGVGYQDTASGAYMDKEWVKQQYRYYYASVVRMYPEIKAFVAFNTTVGGDAFRYDIHTQPEAVSVIQEMTTDPLFKLNSDGNSDIAYRELSDMSFDNELKLSAAAYVKAQLNPTVKYSIDGVEQHATTLPPYDYTLNASNMTPGQHLVSIAIIADGGVNALQKDYLITYGAESNPVVTEPMESIGEFKDIPLDYKAWLEAPLLSMVEKGIIKGTKFDEFEPKNNIIRGDFVLMLARALGIDDEEIDEEYAFDDVPTDMYYAKAITAAHKYGITNGDAPTLFKPEQALTREEMITLLYNTLNKFELIETTNELTFDDVDEISDWAKTPISSLTSAKLINGFENKITPLENAERAHAAKIMDSVYDMLLKVKEQIK